MNIKGVKVLIDNEGRQEERVATVEQLFFLFKRLEGQSAVWSKKYIRTLGNSLEMDPPGLEKLDC